MSATGRIRVAEVLEATTGGTRRHLYDLVTGLDRTRFDVSVICATRRDPAFLEDLDAMRRAGASVRIVQMTRGIRPTRDTAAFLRLRRELARGAFDVVHAHSSKAGFLARAAARAAGRAWTVYSPHGFAFDMAVAKPWRILYRWLEQQAGRLTDRLVCVCEQERAAALQHRIVPAGRAVVIANGIRPQPPADTEAVAALRTGLNLRPDALVVGLAGRMDPQKGGDILLRAAPDVLRLMPNSAFVFWGEGRDRPALERLAMRLGVAAQCRFPGARRDLAPAYGLMDVMALPSRWEALPYSLLEAMAAGCAVVASDVGGMPETVGRGAAGLIVPPGDPQALAGAIGRLLADPPLRAAMGRTARQVVAKRHGIDGMIEGIANVYEEGVMR